MALITLLNPSRRGKTRRRKGNPAHLTIINGKRRTNVATRRRRRKSTRRAVSNPRRRRRAAAAPRRRRRVNRRRRTTTVINRRRRRANPVRRRRRSRRRSNPVRRRRHSVRRSNPALKGMIEGSMAAVAGMMITDFVQGMVPFSFGGAIGKVAIRFGLAYAVGVAAEKFGPTRKYATWLAVGGAVGAAQDLFRLFMGGGLTASPAQGQMRDGRVAVPAALTGDDQGMGDIVGVPAGWGGLGEIVGTNYPAGYFQ